MFIGLDEREGKIDDDSKSIPNLPITNTHLAPLLPLIHRAGRPGRAITFFTEADFDNLRTIANVMRLSGCTIPEWMLSMKKTSSSSKKKVSAVPPRRVDIDTTPRYDRKNNKKRKRQNNNNKKKEQVGGGPTNKE